MRGSAGTGVVVLGVVLACGGGGPSVSAQNAADELNVGFDIELPASAPQLGTSDHFGLLHADGAVLTILNPADGAVLHTQTVDCELDLAGLDTIGFKGLHLPCADGTARMWKPDAALAEAVARPAPPGPDFSAADDRQAWTAVAAAEDFTDFSAYAGPEGVDLFDGTFWLRRLDTPNASALATDGRGNLFVATATGVTSYVGGFPLRMPSGMRRAAALRDLSGSAKQPTEQAGAEPSAAPSVELEATLEKVSGGTLTLAKTGGPEVQKGVKGTLSKYVEKKFFGANVTMWLTIAEVEVTSVSGDQIKVKILEEKSETVVDGKKVDMFTAGARTRLAWAP